MMIKNSFNILGVMSGTSLDGIDIAHLHFMYRETWSFEILQAETIPYPLDWLQYLKKLTALSIQELRILDEDYTIYLSKVIKQFIDKHHIVDIDAVCSHGHTALHQPLNGLTYQIGNLPKLAYLINQKVVCDFRVEDVALGGQGAPLVPIGDRLLFSDYDFCLNLGGFANISTEIEGQRIAYDICPVNIVMNYYMNILGLDYDDGGQLASKGELNHTLLQQLNAIEFYLLTPPKSLGLEWVENHIFPIIDGFQMEIKDILRTFVEHVAIQISRAISLKKNGSILITGGGAYNNFLIDRLNSHTDDTLVIPNKNIVEFKEALIFGLLGVLKLRNEINCLRSVTGASKDHSSGKIYCP